MTENRREPQPGGWYIDPHCNNTLLRLVEKQDKIWRVLTPNGEKKYHLNELRSCQEIDPEKYAEELRSRTKFLDTNLLGVASCGQIPTNFTSPAYPPAATQEEAEDHPYLDLLVKVLPFAQT